MTGNNKNRPPSTYISYICDILFLNLENIFRLYCIRLSYCHNSKFVFSKNCQLGGLFTGIDQLIDYSGTDQGAERDNCIYAH